VSYDFGPNVHGRFSAPDSMRDAARRERAAAEESVSHLLGRAKLSPFERGQVRALLGGARASALSHGTREKLAELMKASEPTVERTARERAASVQPAGEYVIGRG